MKFTGLGVPAVTGDLEQGLENIFPDWMPLYSPPVPVDIPGRKNSGCGSERCDSIDQGLCYKWGWSFCYGQCDRCGPKFGIHPNSTLSESKGVADGYLRASGLDYTILAPGTLLDEPGTGRIQVSEELGFHGFLPREDLATCIIETLRNVYTIGKTIEIVSGSDKIKDAMVKVAGGGDLPPIA